MTAAATVRASTVKSDTVQHIHNSHCYALDALKQNSLLDLHTDHLYPDCSYLEFFWLFTRQPYFGPLDCMLGFSSTIVYMQFS